jgi:hypothetical protein
MATAAAEVASQPAATPAKVAKPKTVIENMDSRRMFDSIDDTLAYLNQSGETLSDFANHPQIINGLTMVGEGDDATPTLDPAVYGPGMRAMVAVLANRGVKGQPSTVKAIVVTPAPSFDMILADENARKWAERIIDKELNHVAVRALRNADDPESVQDQMPLTLADYISSSRESSGGIMETFNTMFKGIIASVAAKSPNWAKARLTKNELKKAFESKAYALEYYPQLEDRDDKPSLFVMALQLGEREAKKQGLDPAIFAKWLETRDAKELTVATNEESDDFDLDDLAFEVETPAATEPTAEPAATTATA